MVLTSFTHCLEDSIWSPKRSSFTSSSRSCSNTLRKSCKCLEGWNAQHRQHLVLKVPSARKTLACLSWWAFNLGLVIGGAAIAKKCPRTAGIRTSRCRCVILLGKLWNAVQLLEQKCCCNIFQAHPLTFLAHFNAIFVSKTATKVVSTDASSPNAEIGHFSVIFRLSDHPEVTWSS